MKIDKNTQLCISISSNPGNTGTTIHNALYKKHNLNFPQIKKKLEKTGGFCDCEVLFNSTEKIDGEDILR